MFRQEETQAGWHLLWQKTKMHEILLIEMWIRFSFKKGECIKWKICARAHAYIIYVFKTNLPHLFFLSKALFFHLLIDRIVSEGKYYNPGQCNDININNNKYKLWGREA